MMFIQYILTFPLNSNNTLMYCDQISWKLLFILKHINNNIPEPQRYTHSSSYSQLLNANIHTIYITLWYRSIITCHLWSIGTTCKYSLPFEWYTNGFAVVSPDHNQPTAQHIICRFKSSKRALYRLFSLICQDSQIKYGKWHKNMFQSSIIITYICINVYQGKLCYIFYDCRMLNDM